MARVDVSQYQTFGQINDRLGELVGQVRDKDVSLERSLDLFEEAVALGSKAVSLVDATDFSPEEEARLADADADADTDAPADAEKGDAVQTAAEAEPAADGQ